MRKSENTGDAFQIFRESRFAHMEEKKSAGLMRSIIFKFLIILEM